MFSAKTLKRVLSSEGGCGRLVGNSGNLTGEANSGVVEGRKEVSGRREVDEALELKR